MTTLAQQIDLFASLAKLRTHWPEIPSDPAGESVEQMVRRCCQAYAKAKRTETARRWDLEHKNLTAEERIALLEVADHHKLRALRAEQELVNRIRGNR